MSNKPQTKYWSIVGCLAVIRCGVCATRRLKQPHAKTCLDDISLLGEEGESGRQQPPSQPNLTIE